MAESHTIEIGFRQKTDYTGLPELHAVSRVCSAVRLRLLQGEDAIQCSSGLELNAPRCLERIRGNSCEETAF